MDGNIKPTYIEWQKDGVVLKAQKRKYIIAQDGHTLHILNLNKTDNGRYECISWNDIHKGWCLRPYNLKNIIPPEKAKDDKSASM